MKQILLVHFLQRNCVLFYVVYKNDILFVSQKLGEENGTTPPYSNIKNYSRRCVHAEKKMFSKRYFHNNIPSKLLEVFVVVQILSGTKIITIMEIYIIILPFIFTTI